jgi:predicted enzyme related to lactoylglutathione lyase
LEQLMMPNAKLIMISVPSSNPAASRGFYASLLGIEFANALWEEGEAYHAPISPDGVMLSINQPHGSTSPIAIFAVADLNGQLQNAQRLGCAVVYGPTPMPIAPSGVATYRAAYQEIYGQPPQGNSSSLGTAAIVRDPGGASVSLVQLEEHANQTFLAGPLQPAFTNLQVQAHEKALAITRA